MDDNVFPVRHSGGVKAEKYNAKIARYRAMHLLAGLFDDSDLPEKGKAGTPVWTRQYPCPADASTSFFFLSDAERHQRTRLQSAIPTS